MYSFLNKFLSCNGKIFIKKGCYRYLSFDALPSLYLSKDRFREFLKSDGISCTDSGLKLLGSLDSKSESIGEFYGFASKIHTADSSSLDFCENIIKRFATSQVSLQMPSVIHHIIINSYIYLNQYERITKLICDRKTSQLFIDPVSANILMDYFIKENKIENSMVVAFESCIQELLIDPSNQLTIYFSLLTTAKYIDSKNFTAVCSETLDKSSSTQNSSEEEEETYVLVPYIKNKNPDDLFQIKSHKIMSGIVLKNLISVLSRMGILNENDMQILNLYSSGLTENTKSFLANLETKSLSIPNYDIVNDLLVIWSGDPMHPKHMEESKPSAKWSESLAEIEAKLKSIQPMDSNTNMNSVVAILENAASKLSEAPNFLEEEMKKVDKLYEGFESDRNNIIQSDKQDREIQQTINEIKTKLEDLVDREERLTFFDNQPTIELKSWLAPRTRAERSSGQLKQWRNRLKRYNEKGVGIRS